MFIIRDSYTSLKLIRKKFLLAQIEALKDKDKEDWSAEDDAQLKALEEELEPIVNFLDDAKKQRDAILVEIGMPFCFNTILIFTYLLLASLQQDYSKCVIVVDFTKWGLVVNGNVHCFVVCVLYGERLKDPPGMTTSLCLLQLLICSSMETEHQVFRLFCAKYKGRQSQASFSICKGL